MTTPGDRLKQARIDAGFESIAEASRQTGLHKQNLADHEAGRRGISTENAKIYARKFKKPSAWILLGVEDTEEANNEIQVVGYVGAGGNVSPIDDHAKGAGLDTVEAIGYYTPSSVAVIVRGNSMFDKFHDGDIIIYDERRADIIEFLGRRDCIVGLADGRIMVKRIVRGSTENLYTLVSSNHPPIEDVVIEWCARIRSVNYKE